MATTSSLPPAAAEAATAALTEAMAAASIAPAEPSASASASKPANGGHGEPSDLEDGEIREDAEEDDGRVKTVFDDAARFNVKVSETVDWEGVRRVVCEAESQSRAGTG